MTTILRPKRIPLRPDLNAAEHRRRTAANFCGRSIHRAVFRLNESLGTPILVDQREALEPPEVCAATLARRWRHHRGCLEPIGCFPILGAETDDGEDLIVVFGPWTNPPRRPVPFAALLTADGTKPAWNTLFCE